MGAVNSKAGENDSLYLRDQTRCMENYPDCYVAESSADLDQSRSLPSTSPTLAIAPS
jgi:hypothetical protein